MNSRFHFSILAAVLCLSTAANAATIEVQVDRPGAAINPAMWGVFFEDINFGADGGLYAELVKNRSFEFPEPLRGWSKLDAGAVAGSLQICENTPLNPNNPHYLRIACESADGAFGVANEGFSG